MKNIASEGTELKKSITNTKQQIETLKNSKEEIENTSQEDIDYDYE